MKKKIISSSIGSLIKSVISDLVIGSVCLGVGGVACTHEACGMVQSSSVYSAGRGQPSFLPADEYVRDFLVNAFTGEISSYNERQIQFTLDHSRKHFVQQDAQSAENECKKILTTFCFSDDFAGELIEGLVKKDNITSYEVNNQGASGFPRITFKADIARTWPAAKLKRRTEGSRSNITFLDSLMKYLVLKVDINANGVYASSMCTSYVKPCYIEVREVPKDQLDTYCSEVKDHLSRLSQDKLLNYPWWSSKEFPPFYTIGRFVNTRMLFDSLIEAMHNKKGEIDTKRYINAKVKFDDNVSAWVSIYDVPISDLNAEMRQLLGGTKTQIFHRNEHSEVRLLEERDLALTDMARLVIRWTDSGTNKVVTGGTMYVIPPNILAQCKSTKLVMPDDEEIYAPAEITTISSAESKLSAHSSAEMTKIETGSLTIKQEEPRLKEGDLNKPNQAQRQLDIIVLTRDQIEPELVTYEKFRDMCSKDLPIEAIKIVKRSSECRDEDIAELLSLLNGNGNIQDLKGFHISGGVSLTGIKNLVSILESCRDSIEMVTLDVKTDVKTHEKDLLSVYESLDKCKSLARCVLPKNDQLFTEEKSVPLTDLLYLEGLRIFMSEGCLLCDKWSDYSSVQQEQYLRRSLSFDKGMLEKLVDAKTVNISEAVDLQSYFRILLKNKKLKELKVSNNIMYAGDICALINLISEVPLEVLELNCDMRANRLMGLFAALTNNCMKSSLIECILPSEEQLLTVDDEDKGRKLTPDEVKSLNWMKYDIWRSCVNRKKMQPESKKKVRTRSVENGKWYETELITSEDGKITGINVRHPRETIVGIKITGYCDLLPILKLLVNKSKLKELFIEQNFVTGEEQEALSNVIESGAIETIDVSKCAMDGDQLELLDGIMKSSYLRKLCFPGKIILVKDARGSDVKDAIVVRDEIHKKLAQSSVCCAKSIIGKTGSSYGGALSFTEKVEMKTKGSKTWEALTPSRSLSKLKVTEVKISSSDSLKGTVRLSELFDKLFNGTEQCGDLNTLKFSKVKLMEPDINKLKVDSLEKITLDCYMDVQTFLALADKIKSSTSLTTCVWSGLEFFYPLDDKERKEIQSAKEAIIALCEANKSRKVAATKKTKSKTYHKKKKK